MAHSVALVAPADSSLDRFLREIRIACTVHPATALAGMSRSGAAVPDIVLVDLRGQPKLMTDVAALKRQHAHVGVAIVATLDPALMLEAMRAGITECITEPIDRQQIESAIARLTAVAPADQRGEVFAFVGAKGGVGTTTLAVNTASVLAKAGNGPVLLIDLHLAYGDAAVFLGAEPKFSIVDALENTHRLDETFLKGVVVKSSAGVDLIASADRDPGRPVDIRGIPAIVDLASRQYRYVILDVPRAGRATVDPLALAQTVIVVANHELSAVRSASLMAAALRDKYGAARVSIVVSRFDKESDISHRDIERAVGESVKFTFPSDYRVALEALNRGRPLVLDNHTKLAASMKAFARSLAGIQEEPAPAEVRGGLLGRLTGKR